MNMAVNRQTSMEESTLTYLEGMLTSHDEPAMSQIYRESYAAHANGMLQRMHECFKEEKFCDVTLCVEDRDFKVQRLVLSSLSLYFSGLFNDSWEDSRQDNIDMRQFNEATLNSILHFAYTGELQLKPSIVLKILSAADFLQLFELDFVRDSCGDYLQKQVSSENCTAMLVIAEQFHVEKLKSFLLSYASRNFYQVGGSEDFMKLPVDLLVQILECESLVVTCGRDFLPPIKDQEDFVLDIVLKYVSHRCEGESDSLLSKLIRNVRLLCLSLSSLEKLRSYAEGASCSEALRLTEQAISGNNPVRSWARKREAVSQCERCWRTYANRVHVGPTLRTFGDEGYVVEDEDLFIKGMKLWIRLWDGHRVIGGLQVFYSNDESPLYGGSDEDSDVYEFHLKEDERIVKTEIHAGWMIDHLKFFTNKGRELGPYGGPGGRAYVEQPRSKYGFLSFLKGSVVDAEEKLAVTKLQLIWIEYLAQDELNYSGCIDDDPGFSSSSSESSVQADY